MAKKPAPTLLAQAYNGNPKPRVHDLPTEQVPSIPGVSPTTPPPTPTVRRDASYYLRILSRFPCDTERRQFMAEQINASLEWGGDDHVIRMPMRTLLAILDAVDSGNGTPNT